MRSFFIFLSRAAAMLRKKYHVVRKKNHVVRKLFYVASIFGGAAGRKHRPPWKLSSTPWTLSSTAGTLSPTASRQCVTEHPHFLGNAQTSLPDTDNFDKSYTLELDGMAQHAGGGQGLHPAAAFPFRHRPLSHPLYAITPPASQGTQAG